MKREGLNKIAHITYFIVLLYDFLTVVSNKIHCTVYDKTDLIFISTDYIVTLVEVVVKNKYFFVLHTTFYEH